MGKQMQDSFKSAKEQASNSRDSANDFVKGIYGRAKQTADKIFG